MHAVQIDNLLCQLDIVSQVLGEAQIVEGVDNELFLAAQISHLLAGLLMYLPGSGFACFHTLSRFPSHVFAFQANNFTLGLIRHSRYRCFMIESS
jgi:hypothetical protein